MNRPPPGKTGSKKNDNGAPPKLLHSREIASKNAKIMSKFDEFTVNSDTDIRRKRGLATNTHENAEAIICRKNAYETPKIHQES